MVAVTFLLQAVSLAVLAVGLAILAGIPLPIETRVPGVEIVGSAGNELRGFLDQYAAPWQAPAWTGQLAGDVLLPAVLTVTALLVALAPALVFLGWMLAERRRQFAGAVAAT
jgi:hypothetical protein